MKKGEEKGYQRGSQDGLEQGKKEMAKALKQEGVNWQVIAKTSGLPLEVIEKL